MPSKDQVALKSLSPGPGKVSWDSFFRGDINAPDGSSAGIRRARIQKLLPVRRPWHRAQHLHESQSVPGGSPVSASKRSPPTPSGGFKYTFAPVPRSAAKARYLKSGDQRGATSSLGSFVSWTGSPPAAGIMKISMLPSLLLLKAIMSPSGDQLGVTSQPVMLVAV